ncbi:MAG: adenylosuccinate lyase family protein [Syntrophales bacterium]|nr:adenylosuccinate lyase family protein [Syntrophales bacterium]
MALHILDSTIYGKDFASSTIRQIWEEESIIQDWIDFEVVLAEVQAELGFIPKTVADEIKAKGNTKFVKPERVAAIYAQTMLSSVSLIRAFKEVCENGAGEYLHYGATSQDIFDTTLAYRLKKTMDIFQQDLDEIKLLLNNLADKYRDAIMPGITHGQQALPITFGYNTAIWSDMVRKHIDRFQNARERILVGTVSAAVGNFASFYFLFGEKCYEMQNMVLDRFGLKASVIDIQPQIERLSEFLQLLALMSISFEKIADELFLFQRNEFAQTEEPFDTERQISSSTMPQKRNPNRCEMIRALAKKIRSNSNGFSEIYMRELRDHSPFYLEDFVIPETILLASTMLNQAKIIFKGLVVKPENMERNLKMSGGLIMTEAIMLALSKKTGKKETGLSMVHESSMEAFEKGIPFDIFISTSPKFQKYFTQAEITELLDPRNYLGLTDRLINDVIGKDKK